MSVKLHDCPHTCRAASRPHAATPPGLVSNSAAQPRLGSAQAELERRRDEADVGQRIDAELLVEVVLRLGELDIGEEEVTGTEVVGDDGGREECKLSAELE